MTNNNSKKIRLNRFIAMCGVCSRRKADALIKEGKIVVNKKVIDNLGFQVSIEDTVLLNGQKIFPENKKYILLNKPRGYITTMKDEKGRRTVMSLVINACKERLVPVGRLDKDTTGLLLFTNDGLLAKKLTHPTYQVAKTYHVFLDKNLNLKDLEFIKNGITLEDGFVKPDSISYIDNGSAKGVKINVHIGKNRIVRRIFEHLNYKVLELDRVEYAIFKKEKLKKGRWRVVTNREIHVLNKKIASFVNLFK